MKTSHRVVKLVAALALVALPGAAGAQSFVPDQTLHGDTFGGWRAQGNGWSIKQGLVTKAADPLASGWLFSDRSLQDVAVSGEVKCTSACEIAVLLRPQEGGAGRSGVYLILAPQGGGVYHARVNRGGEVVDRVPLRGAPSMLRIAPPAGPGGEGGALPQGRATSPAMLSLPVKGPDTQFRPSEWNRFEVLLDANIIRAFLNEGGAGNAALDTADGFGPFGIRVRSAGDVQFRNLAYKNLADRDQGRETLSSRFEIQRLDPFFYSWSSAVADLNRDGVTDVIAGPNYYLGPNYDVRRELTLSETYSPSTDSPVFQVELAADFTGDGWPDVLDASLNRPGKLYVNPRGEPRRWTMSEVLPRMGGELALLTDMDEDGKPEALVYVNATIALASPGTDPTQPWTIKPISAAAAWGQHGMGVGDVNGDGRKDVVQAQGWFEQPPKGQDGLWTYHPQAFSRGGRTAIGGSRMAVYDVNGDGLADVVTALQAHDAGLSWFEQKRAPDGAVSFVEHPIMKGFNQQGNAGGIVFSQPHGAAAADIDGDGVPDFIVGKRHWSHHEGTSDPGTEGPAVLYVYRTVRNPRAPGGAEFVPELLHNRSGAGSQVEALDMNRDGRTDVVTVGDHGTFIFWGKESPR